jgi:hypothetical protein
MRKATAPSKVLELLAKQPGLTRYNIAIKSKLSHSRIHESVQLLIKTRLIKGTIVGKPRAGHTILACSLTLKGLVLALHDQPELWKDIDDIVLKHRLIGPLVFKKWDQFVKAGARNVVLSRLKRAFGKLAQAHIAPFTERQYGADDVEYIDGNVLGMDIVFFGQVFSESEITSFITVLSTDTELESFVIKHNEEDIKSTTWLLENKKAYDSAIQQNRPELFLSKLEHHAPLPKVWEKDVPLKGRGKGKGRR